MYQTSISRAMALELLLKYNKEPYHIYHALTVSCVMDWFARELGYEEEAEFWSLVGLLHDVDYGQFPEDHCCKAPDLLQEISAEPEFIHAVCSHGYGICSEIKPVHEMEKVLYACDELTGLIAASIKMRPSKSVLDMEVKSVKKKFKDTHFAAGCSRETMKKGVDMLGWELNTLFSGALKAMQACEDSVLDEMANLGLPFQV